MVEVLPTATNTQDLMEKIVSDINSLTCMLHQCENCPGKQVVNDHILKDCETQGYDNADSIKYTAWTQTDISDVITEECQIEQFTENLTNLIDLLTSHHYIAKHQSKALRLQKEALKADELLITGDFAENYSFFVQYAIQGWHWVNSQATLNPFCVYF